MNEVMFTKDELAKMKDGDIVGYDNGNGEMFPVRAHIDNGDFSDSEWNYFSCDEYDYSYCLVDLTSDWFVKA